MPLIRPHPIPTYSASVPPNYHYSYDIIPKAKAFTGRLNDGEDIASSRASSGEGEEEVVMADDTCSPEFTYPPVSLKVSDSS